MKTTHVALSAVALTLGIALAGGYWALCPMMHWPISILGEVDAARIRSLFPIHVIDPSRIHASAVDLPEMWILAEFKARAGISLIVWLGALIGFFVWLRRRRAAINSVQPTRAIARG